MRKLLLLLALVLSAVNQLSAITYKTTNSTATLSSGYTVWTENDVTWNLGYTWSSGSYFSNDTDGLKIGSKSNKIKNITMSTSDIIGVVTSVTVKCKAASTAPTLGVSVGDDKLINSTKQTETVNLSSSLTEYTFTGSASGDITISFNSSGVNYIYIKEVTVEYTPSSIELGDFIASYSDCFSTGNAISEDANILVPKTATFTFASKYAESISVKVGDNEATTLSGATVNWTPNEILNNETVTLTASRTDSESKTFSFVLSTRELETATYSKISTADELEADQKYILVGYNNSTIGIMGSNNSTYRNSVTKNATSLPDEYTVTEGDGIYPFTIVENDGKYVFQLENGNYIASASLSSADLTEAEDATTASANFSISFDDESGKAIISNGSYVLCYNGGANPTRFKTYGKEQTPTYLYKIVVAADDDQDSDGNDGEEEGDGEEEVVMPTTPTYTIDADAKTGKITAETGVLMIKIELYKKYDETDAASYSDVKVQDWTPAEDNSFEFEYATLDGIYLISMKSVTETAESEIVQFFIGHDGLVSGINEVSTDTIAAPAEYYNLQGQRVAANKPGLYIRVQGNRAEKISIR
jgi:hypothetical protein